MTWRDETLLCHIHQPIFQTCNIVKHSHNLYTCLRWKKADYKRSLAELWVFLWEAYEGATELTTVLFALQESLDRVLFYSPSTSSQTRHCPDALNQSFPAGSWHVFFPWHGSCVSEGQIDFILDVFSWTNSSPILGGLNAHPLYTKLSPNHQEVRWRQQSLQQGNGQWEYDQALRQGKWDHPPKKTPKKVVEKSTSSCLHKKYAVDSSWWKYDLWLCTCVFVGDWFDTWSGAGEDNHFYTPSLGNEQRKSTS